MRYQSRSSVAYMLRNLLQLVYVTLPIAALMAFAAFMYKPTVEAELFVKLVTGGVTDYTGELLGSLTVLRYGAYWWVFAIALLVLPLSCALMVAKLDRHMKTGHMPALPFKRAFALYPFTLMYVLGFAALSELGCLVAVGVAFLIRFVGNATAITAIVLCLTFLLRGLTAYLFALLLQTLPLKYSESYSLNRAMSYSARMMFGKKRLVWAFTVSYPIVRAAVLALAYLLAPYKLDGLVYLLVFFFAFSYLPCLAYKLYYDDVGGERRDVGKIMFG